MRTLALLASAVIIAATAAAQTALSNSTNAPTVLLVVGAAGEAEFGSNFVQQARLWETTCQKAGARMISIGLGSTNEAGDYEQLKQRLAGEAAESGRPLWLVLIGHGTFDGKEGRFNLRGPDVSAAELSDWLKACRRPLILINTTSASAPFLNRLSGTNRVVITATRAGSEQNFTRFGQYLAEAIGQPQSDLDQDGQTSLLEAFLAASARVMEFYKTEGRLATEHALIDDNGDGLGTPAEWFRGVRATRKPQKGSSLDGARAHQVHLVLSPAEQALPAEVRNRRDALELEILRLREAKSAHDEEAYYTRLEALLLELARLHSTNRVVR